MFGRLQRRTSNRLIFYLMFGYILASFLWWSVLFLRNNSREFREDSERYREAWIARGMPEAGFEASATFQALEAELRKRNMMIMGEGLVFITLISIGFWKINQSFRKEIELTRQQNNFILSITHELKSPLASIKLSVETLRKRKLEAPQVERISGLCLDDVDRLERMVENILLASRLEDPGHHFQKNWFDLSGLCLEAAEKLQRKYPAHTFEKEIEEGIQIEGDAFAFSSVVLNLLENAFKYTPEGRLVRLDLHQLDGRIRLSVRDRGRGIPETERTKIFRRFYRIGDEETRVSKGTGLGLFIVQEIVRGHGGQINVQSNRVDGDEQGSLFEVFLPIGQHQVESVASLEPG